MSYHSVHNFRGWVKTSPNPIAKCLYQVFYELRAMDLPAPKIIYGPLYGGYNVIKGIIDNALRVLLWTPMFKSQVEYVGRYLYLFGGMPYLAGPLHIELGDHCRLSGKTTITGRGVSHITPTLSVGDNCDIGWMTTIAVGSTVRLGNNVRIAGQCFLAGYPGHPLDAKARAEGKPEEDFQVGDIILEDDVWLATGVSVMAGVTIGKGAIVAAQSVVTHDIPPFVLAAGCPARVVRSLDAGEQA